MKKGAPAGYRQIVARSPEHQDWCSRRPFPARLPMAGAREYSEMIEINEEVENETNRGWKYPQMNKLMTKLTSNTVNTIFSMDEKYLSHKNCVCCRNLRICTLETDRTISGICGMCGIEVIKTRAKTETRLGNRRRVQCDLLEVIVFHRKI